MTEDFTGFRNFFTLNFIAKPIYNAYRLSSKLYSGLVEHRVDNDNISVIATKSENGEYMIGLCYSDKTFSENIPTLSEKIALDDSIIGRTVTLWCIDKENTNPYRLYERLGAAKPTSEEIMLLRNEGELKPLSVFIASENTIEINLSANSTYFISIK